MGCLPSLPKTGKTNVGDCILDHDTSCSVRRVSPPQMLLPILVTLLPLLPAASPTPKVPLRGVPPSKAHLYTQSTSKTWKCLDGSLTIPYSALNDDYCDCPDGSDEPGTSACANGLFWCANEGHQGAYIRSSRVGDGLCGMPASRTPHHVV